MKYSLRSLMMGMTLFCILLGARVVYLRRMAAFHAAEVTRTDGTEDILPLLRHHALAVQYSRAVYRPWTIVREPTL
ncbi:MAG: hypothetical protein IAF94_15760 [Pirellulaceae bacterium]|nr:hypothetical protein [Pirellulaceae bacterium]